MKTSRCGKDLKVSSMNNYEGPFGLESFDLEDPRPELGSKALERLMAERQLRGQMISTDTTED